MLSLRKDTSSGLNSQHASKGVAAELSQQNSMQMRYLANVFSKQGNSMSSCRLSLSLLDMRNNNIQTLPPELGLMSSLRFLGIQGNPIRGIRPTLLSAAVAEILKFLRSRLDVVSLTHKCCLCICNV